MPNALPTASPRRSNRSHSSRRGSIIVLAAFLMVGMLAIVAMAIDFGYIVSVRTDAQRTADAAALAGAGAIVDGAAAANSTALQYLALNGAGGRAITASEATITLGSWNPNSSTFTATNHNPSAVRVVINSNQYPLFFGSIFGMPTFTMQAEATATYQPRDIVLALDYSGSMTFDSMLSAISDLGRPYVENNLQRMWQQIGSPTYGNMTFTPRYISSTNVSTVRNQLGLNNVAYPFSGGSWDEYINYVMSDSSVNSAGYRRYYGYLTWMDYLQSQRRSYSNTPVLWKTSQQPLAILKDAVDEFIAYLQQVETQDRIGFSLYNSSSGDALLEIPLTYNLTSIAERVRLRQAGHYNDLTNISAGMRVAREELVRNARPGALKMIVLMTDGVANLPGSGSTPRNSVLSEANLCAAARIPVVAIALGSGADTGLMQEVANRTGGVAFIVPGGQSIAQMQQQLEDIFRQVASDRPLKLVQ